MEVFLWTVGFESEFESESEIDHRSVDMLLATC